MLKDLYAGDRIIRFLFTVIRNLFKKLKPSITNCKYYEHFSNEAYRLSPLHELSKEVFVNNVDGLPTFLDININILNRHIPCKRKHGRGNKTPFVRKDL